MYCFICFIHPFPRVEQVFRDLHMRREMKKVVLLSKLKEYIVTMAVYFLVTPVVCNIF